VARRLGLLCVLALGLTGCSNIPTGRSALDDVSFRGVSRIDVADLEGKLATEASPKFLGLFRGFLYDYEIFDRATLERDLARVERYYQARGYFDAHARAGRVLDTRKNHVRVEIVVEEGNPTRNLEIRVTGIEGLPPLVAAAALTAARAALATGQPFDEARYEEAEVKARLALTDRGYAFAKVTRGVYLDIVNHVAQTTLDVVPQEPARFGAVTIVGLDPDGAGHRRQELRARPLLRTIDIGAGEPFSTARIASATQALLDLGVLAVVEIVPDLSHPETHVVPLTVRVEPGKLRQIRLGVGAEFDEIKTELHGIVGWEDHNFLGGLRHFSVTLTPGLVLYPTRIDKVVAPNNYFPEEKLRLELKQPGLFEARTTGFLRPELNVFPLLVQTSPAPGDPVVGYREFKGAVGLERAFLKYLYVSLSYDVQVENPFSYLGALDPDLTTLVIGYPELITRLDLRDDHNKPHKGLFVSNVVQIAGGIFGGSTEDVKIVPEVRTYVPVAKKVTFATRASLGFLFPINYGDVIKNQLNDPVTAANRGERVRDIETVFFRGLYSGGPTTNRGFPIRGIAPYGVVPFLNPVTAAQQVAILCDPTSNPAYASNPSCSIPIGGFSLWELSAEIRFDVKGPFSAATFCDSGDVSPHTLDIRLSHLHLSCGVGARYETPVGAIRLDLGYRIQALQVLGYADDYAAAKADPSNGIPPRILGIPVAIAIGIGEAY
jgi:outer membrane protein assembly factor BamA